MQIEKILMPHEVIKNREIPMNSIVLYLENNTILVCSNFNHSRKNKIELFAWLPAQKKWVKTYAKNEYTEIMWDYYRKHQKKQNNKRINYTQLMKHDRKHKSGGGGSRIYNGTVTDYECAKEPMHDFRRSMCVHWN